MAIFDVNISANANRMKLITKIAKELQGVTSKWFEVATLLGIPVDKLNSIKEDCDDTEGCFKGVIKVSLERIDQ